MVTLHVGHVRYWYPNPVTAPLPPLPCGAACNVDGLWHIATALLELVP